MLLGEDCVKILAEKHVMVFGLGGVGSYACEALARSGVGRITIVDFDDISLTNLNRQLGALHSTLGMKKTDAIRNRLLDINPDADIISRPEYFSRENMDGFFNLSCDYIIDAIDLVSCKLDLIETAINRGIPIISSMGTGNKLDPTRFKFTDISQTQFCPLARIIRKELRGRGILHHRVLYSPEPAREPLLMEEPPPGRRSIPASAPWVPACAGMMLTGDVVLSLLNITE